MLHCPNKTTLAAVRGALQRGDLFMHAFPHNGEASAFPDASLFDAALGMSQALALDLNITAPTAVSQRDVPGWTRAAIPILHRRGINGLSFGAGQPPGKPDVPPLFVWRDDASGTDVVVTYESGWVFAQNHISNPYPQIDMHPGPHQRTAGVARPRPTGLYPAMILSIASHCRAWPAYGACPLAWRLHSTTGVCPFNVPCTHDGQQ